MVNYAKAIQDGYKNIPYHNKTHGADLCQTIYYFLQKGDPTNLLKLDEFDFLSIFTAASVHDFQHPGVNNEFLIKIQDPIAIRHNDISVLENHHVAAAFELMLGNTQYNWAAKFNT